MDRCETFEYTLSVQTNHPSKVLVEKEYKLAILFLRFCLYSAQRGNHSSGEKMVAKCDALKSSRNIS